MINLKNILLAFGISALSLSACKKEVTTPPPANEGELITTVVLTLVDQADSTKVYTFKFVDLDGDGGNPPSKFDTIRVPQNSTLIGNIEFLDESKNPVEEITEEIEEEASEHQLFYIASGVNVTIATSDVDAENRPLGLKSVWTAGEASNGTVKVTLKHQPNNTKPATPGNITVGDTDVELNFFTQILP